MTNDERLNLRARQLMDDDTLSQNQRLQNPSSLLRQLAVTTQSPDLRQAVLDEITDPDIQARFAAALDAALT